MNEVARVYDPVDPDQPPRVMVDRLWPRGIHKEDPRVGTWMPEVAPSGELRTWFHHHPDQFDQFTKDYRAELADTKARTALAELRKLCPVTLVTAAKDPAHSHIAVLTAELSH